MNHNVIYMIGDSIMQTNKFNTYPQTGWGQVLNLFAKDEYQVINLAKNGTSSKSFYDQGRFKYVEDHIKKGDLLIIGFGHNDEKSNDELRYTTPYDTFQKYLEYYINFAKSKKANVVLTTPVIRLKFDNNTLVNTHGEYVDAIKLCAKNNSITCVDLNKKTNDFYNSLGNEKSKDYFMNFKGGIYDNYPSGCEDNSHQRYDGAIKIAKFFVEELFKIDSEIKEYFNELPNPISCAEHTYEK